MLPSLLSSSSSSAVAPLSNALSFTDVVAVPGNLASDNVVSTTSKRGRTASATPKRTKTATRSGALASSSLTSTALTVAPVH